jgi:integration host factor subunit alpha
MSLTKEDLINKVAISEDIPKTKARAILEKTFEIMKHTLSSGEDLMLSGFGKFNVKTKKERRGRNPHTGEDIMLAGRKVVTFSVSGKLRGALNTPEK